MISNQLGRAGRSRRFERSCLVIGLALLMVVPNGACSREEPSSTQNPPPSAPIVQSASSPDQATPTIEWVRESPSSAPSAVEVRGLSPEIQNRLTASPPSAEQWPDVFAVYASESGRSESQNRPPVMGAYEVAGGVIRFVPRFPIMEGLQLRAVYRPAELFRVLGLTATTVAAAIEADLTIPKKSVSPTAVVQNVYPSADVLPENLLRFYIHFSAPMSQRDSYRHIHLVESTGHEVELPFLELGEELWDRSGTRLTLLIDPGRIKRGLLPREEEGPALEEGKSYSLVIDSAWLDAKGAPLKEASRKTFRVTGPDLKQPDPNQWRIDEPKAGTRDPLVVTFPDALDHALLQRMLWITNSGGDQIDGAVTVEEEETRWRFTPVEPWSLGLHHLVVNTTLEDRVGNNIKALFDVDVFEKVQERLTVTTVRVPFEVK